MSDQHNQSRSRDREDEKTKTSQDIVTLARSYDTAMLVSRASDGGPHTRPMSVQQVEDDGRLWFVTPENTDVVGELARDARLQVVMQGKATHLVIDGRATTHRDRAKIKELWSETMRAWFKDENDPSITLIDFTPSEAEYWDLAGTNGLKLAFRAVKAAVTGEPLPEDGSKETHGKVQL